MPDHEIAVGADGSGAVGARDSADVAIVGAGLTGLWTAWYLLQRDPTLRVVVLERDTIGFGASGRNGGWCSALLPMSLDKIAARHGESSARRMYVAMQETVREVGRFVDSHGVSEIFHRGGTITAARNEPQAQRLRHELDEYRRYGFDEGDARWLGSEEATTMLAATDVMGALFTPHCAAVHPLRLTHAVARAAIAAGADVREHTAVTEIRPGSVTTTSGEIGAEIIVRATEGFTPQFAGERRSLLPIYSMMIATEPLPDSTWAQIGLADRQTFADGRHMIIYGQRTADNRFAFGGRGAPYHFGSAIRAEFDTDGTIRSLLASSLRDLFPQIDGVEVTHHWGGVLAAPRRLDLLGPVRPPERSGDCRRLRRRRCQHHQHRGPHTRRADHRRRPGRTHPPTVGRTSFAEVGTRTAPMDRRQCRPHGGATRRRGRDPHRSRQSCLGLGDRPVARTLTAPVTSAASGQVGKSLGIESASTQSAKN